MNKTKLVEAPGYENLIVAARSLPIAGSAASLDDTLRHDVFYKGIELITDSTPVNLQARFIEDVTSEGFAKRKLEVYSDRGHILGVHIPGPVENIEGAPDSLAFDVEYPIMHRVNGTVRLIINYSKKP